MLAAIVRKESKGRMVQVRSLSKRTKEEDKQHQIEKMRAKVGNLDLLIADFTALKVSAY
jgi:hypothetical protein